MRTRKRFGQHFLTDPVVLDRMVDAIALRDGDVVIEVGPGQGALTEHLWRDSVDYTAIEIDRDLIPMLKVRFPKITVINDDVLRIDLAALLEDGCRLVGNLPYNISSPLLLKSAEAGRGGQIVDMHFMLQKEMAQRLTAQPGSKAWGRLSVMMQLLCDVDYLFEVPPTSFTPPPKVWSAVVRMQPRSDAMTSEAQTKLDAVLKAAFSGRRKRLSNSLKRFAIDWQSIDLDPGTRADNVTAQEFALLAELAGQDSQTNR